MPADTARFLEQQPLKAPLEPDLRAFVALAVRVTEEPGAVQPNEVAAAAAAAHSHAEYLDAVGVIVAFNFVTRVASALGVEPEISSWLLPVERARRLGMKLLSLALRWFVDLSPRQLPTPSATENLQRLDQLFRDAELGALPAFFQALAGAPHLLEVQRGLLEECLRPCRRLPPNLFRFMAVGRVTLGEIARESVLYERVASWATTHRAALEETTSPLLDFARDVTLCSHAIVRERIDELRARGLDDAQVLDLVCGIAFWNALGRLEILLTVGNESSLALGSLHLEAGMEPQGYGALQAE